MEQQSEQIFNQWREHQVKLGKDFSTPTSSKDVETSYTNTQVSSVDTSGKIAAAKSTTDAANNLTVEPTNLKQKVDAGLTGAETAVTGKGREIPQPSTGPTQQTNIVPPTNSGYGPYMTTQTVPASAVLQNSGANFDLRDSVLNDGKPTQTQPQNLVSTTAAAASMPVFSSILDYTKQNATGAAEMAGANTPTEVRELQNQVNSLQSQQPSNFDVFQGLNDSNNISAPPPDIYDGKPLIDMNTNSLKQ
jgi:hypothetical protein